MASPGTVATPHGRPKSYEDHRRTILAAHRGSGGTLPFYGGEITNELVAIGRLRLDRDAKGLAVSHITGAGLAELAIGVLPTAPRAPRRGSYGPRVDAVVYADEAAAFDGGEWLGLAMASLDQAGVSADGQRQVRELLGRLEFEVRP